MMFILDDRITLILNILNEYGSAYLVGGAIRDMLLGLFPKDIDIATSIDMFDLINILKDYDPIIISEKYNIIKIRVERLSIEIARFRKEEGILDGRNPKSFEFCYDIREDLKRRDFTVNAMAYNLNDGLIDIYDAKTDIENKVIRIIGDNKVERFKEDNTRILRAFILMSRYDFEIENRTLEAIKETLLGKKLNISNERLSKLLNQIFFEKYSYKSIDLMFKIDLLRVFINEMDKNLIDEETFKRIYLAYKIYCKYNMFEEITIGYAILFIYLGKIKNENMYIIESICIADKYLRKLNVSINDTILIKKLIYYNEIIFKNPTKKAIKQMLLEFRNNKNVSKLLNFISFLHHNSKDYTEIVKKVLDLLIKIQSIYFKGEPVFIKDLDINIVDLCNISLDDKISKENIRQDVYDKINEGTLENNKKDILDYVKEKYNNSLSIKSTKCAGAVIYRKVNNKLEFLLVKVLEGNWGFPKGHVEKGENLEETAIREVKEETNLDIEIISKNFKTKISYVVKNEELKNVTFFIAKANNCDIIIDEDEISEYKWVSYSEGLKLLTYSSQRDVLKKSRLYLFL